MLNIGGLSQNIVKKGYENWSGYHGFGFSYSSMFRWLRYLPQSSPSSSSQLVDHNYAKPHVVLNCVGHWWLRSVIQFDQPLHQDLGHQVENQEATRSWYHLSDLSFIVELMSLNPGNTSWWFIYVASEDEQGSSWKIGSWPWLTAKSALRMQAGIMIECWWDDTFTIFLRESLRLFWKPLAGKRLLFK